ncbi:MAG: twin-arginine translocase subunit TatB [Gammaproteobacteria bacterium]|nr:twin-arginine translocase subunit TatB [Gammaproteobacteria bacterium]
MFEVGFTEIILILGIALLVLGPERLPKLAGHVGRWVGRARAMARQFREQLDEEVRLGDMEQRRTRTPAAAAASAPAEPATPAAPAAPATPAAGQEPVTETVTPAPKE